MQNDVDAIRRVLQEAYATISGPAGERDWDRQARCFIPEARSIVVHRDASGERLELLTVDGYRDSRGPFLEAHSFWETETRCDVIVEGDLAVAMSHYESRWDPAQPPFETGVNSVQLIRMSGEWKIASIMWTAGAAARQVAAIANEKPTR